MTAESWAQLTVVLLAAALVAGAGGWLRFGREVFPPVTLALLLTAGVVAVLPQEIGAGRGTTVLLVALAGLLALIGGGPLTTWVFGVVDRGDVLGPSIDDAARVLRGGAWIGALERVGVFACLVAAFPEGLAIVLALKGVGRFPELRADTGGQATTERFIIGTFTSVLWAAGCAGVVALAAR